MYEIHFYFAAIYNLYFIAAKPKVDIWFEKFADPWYDFEKLKLITIQLFQ